MMSPSWNAGHPVQTLLDAGAISALDRHLAIALGELDPGSGPLVLLAAALASQAVARGHVCVNLREGAGRPSDLDAEVLADEWPTVETLRTALRESDLVSDGSELRPLVLTDDDLLYLQRYHQLEARLERTIRQRSRPLDVDLPALRACLQASSEPLPSELDAQWLACVVALTRRLLLVSGGPGTGKTTTVARMLALLAMAHQHEPGDANLEPLRVLLLGPTGKATQRLQSSLEAGLQRRPESKKLREQFTWEAATVHRALGFRPSAPTHFRHDPDHPLAADVVILDEASMVDLALMTRLMEAIPSEASVLMLGDENQLCSVEAGSIFGDLCAGTQAIARSAEQRRLVTELTGRKLGDDASDPPAAQSLASPEQRALRDGIVRLERNYRYGAESGIGRVSRAIQMGDALEVVRELDRGPDDVTFHELADEPQRATRQLNELVGTLSRKGYRSLLASDDVQQQLSGLDEFRLLAAHRTGPFGVDALNGVVERALTLEGLRPRPVSYDRQPILVTRNDPVTGLYNGDVGLVRASELGTRAHFQVAGKLVNFSLARVPTFETVFAMTVHKSQGSEFERIVVVLPPASSPLASRELIYSAVTRARSHVHLIGSRASVRAAVARRTRRRSGLPRRLWGQVD